MSSPSLQCFVDLLGLPCVGQPVMRGWIVISGNTMQADLFPRSDPRLWPACSGSEQLSNTGEKEKKALSC
jgi:hypothetical protein